MVGTALAESSRTLIIYDSSNSMWAEMADGARRYEAGRSAVTDALAAGLDGHQVGLRAYGHRFKQDCNDTELLVPFATMSSGSSAIQAAVAGIRPTGKTPITRSLIAGLEDLQGQGNILLVTDGIETCDADPCQLASAWAGQGIDVKIHVVGIGLSQAERAALQCISAPSQGLFLDADSVAGLEEAMGAATAEIASTQAAAAIPPRPAELIRFALRGIGPSGNTYQMGGSYQTATGQPVLSGNGQFNVVPEPGLYQVTAGVLSRGRVLSPRTYTITVPDAFDTVIELPVEDPARVQGLFILNGQEVDGDLIQATPEQGQPFRFQPFDTVFAEPGTYVFKAQPNADNSFEVTETLKPGETTIVRFEMTQTINVDIVMIYPDGSIFKPLRGKRPTLWRNGEKAYTLVAGRSEEILAGIYDLRLEDRLTPLAIDGLEIRESGTFEVAVRFGFVEVTPAQSDDFLRKPDRAFVGLPGQRAENIRLGEPTPLLPGRYEMTGSDKQGFFETITFDVAAGETTALTLTPFPVGRITVSYAPGDYDTKPDRAFAVRLDGEGKKEQIFLRADKEVRLLEGEYEISPRKGTGDIAPITVTIRKGSPVEVTFSQ